MMAINCCLHQCTFPENAKIASVAPLNDGKSEKYQVLNYRPEGILSV